MTSYTAGGNDDERWHPCSMLYITLNLIFSSQLMNNIKYLRLMLLRPQGSRYSSNAISWSDKLCNTMPALWEQIKNCFSVRPTSFCNLKCRQCFILEVLSFLSWEAINTFKNLVTIACIPTATSYRQLEQGRRHSHEMGILVWYMMACWLFLEVIVINYLSVIHTYSIWPMVSA